MPSDRMLIGSMGERHALEHYIRLGFEPVELNSRTGTGEIDLIVKRGSQLVFCEVRTRVEGRGNPLESFDRRKALQVRRTVAHWLSQHGRIAGISAIRIDAVAVTVSRDGNLAGLEVLEGAL